MGKNRKTSNAGTNNTPSNNENKEYKETYNTILSDPNNKLNNNELTYLLDNMLGDGMKFEKVTKNGYIMFREYIDGEKGAFVAMNPDSLRDLMEQKAGFGLSELMKAYYEVPEYKRAIVNGVIFGDAKLKHKGGMYNPMLNRISITPKELSEPSRTKANSIEATLEHEFAHALDTEIGTVEYASTVTPGFVDLLKTNKASTYSESYSDPDTRVCESLAEAVAVTRMADKYGGNKAYILDPDIPFEQHKKQPVELTYDDWYSKNKGLGDFARKLVDCKSVSECFEVYIEYGW